MAARSRAGKAPSWRGHEVFPWRWTVWLAETVPEGMQFGLLIGACLAAWWLVFTLLAYPVCRARRINRSVARLLEAAP